MPPMTFVHPYPPFNSAPPFINDPFNDQPPTSLMKRNPNSQHSPGNSTLPPVSTMTSRGKNADLLNLLNLKLKLRPSTLLWNKNLQKSNTTRETIHSAPFKTTKVIRKMNNNNNNLSNNPKKYRSFHP